jgi:hypothetical protein
MWPESIPNSVHFVFKLPVHSLPTLLRPVMIRKFVVGYELLEAQHDWTAVGTARLRG